jgi:hypothetical protein
LCFIDIGVGKNNGQDQRRQTLPIMALCTLTAIVCDSYEQDQKIEGITSSSSSSDILWR